MNGKRLIPAASIDKAVPAEPRNSRHPGTEADAITQGSSQGREVFLDPLRPSGVPRRRSLPPQAVQETSARRVDQLRPLGEQPHVPPFRNRSRGRTASLKHHNGHTSLDQMRGRGKTLRTRADYSHRQDVFHSNLTHPLTNIDG
ncbi:hypothetical protein GCM10009862_20890 [Microbacterium binotii]|uniref:Uncharacterized protein n=1 Tax=Microbacterium binotii TaxID=462710 RepID=A0ABN3PJ06_9MICO